MLVGNIVKNIRMTTPITLGIAGGTGAVSWWFVVLFYEMTYVTSL